MTYMLAILIVISGFFLTSLYLIFIKPHESVRWAGPGGGPQATSDFDKKISSQLQAELARKTDQIKKMELELKEGRSSKIAVLQTRIDELDALLAKKETAINQKDTALIEFQTQATREKQDFSKKISILQFKIDELNSKISKKDAEISHAELLKEENAKKLASLEIQIGELNSKLSEKAELPGILKEKDVIIEQLKSSTHQSNLQIASLQARIDELSARLVEKEGLSISLKEKDVIIEQLKSSTHQGNAQIASLQTRIDELNSILNGKAKENNSLSQSFKSEIEKYNRVIAENEKMLNQLKEENVRLRNQLTEIPQGKKLTQPDRDKIASELRDKLNALKDQYITKITQAKSEIDHLTRELSLKDRAIEELKTGYEKKVSERKPPLKEIETEESKKLKSDYDDLKNKSEWLVKLLREETDKNAKLQKDLENLKIKLAEAPKAEAGKVSAAPRVSGGDEKLEYFLQIYEDNLKNVFYNEETLPKNPEELKELYVKLARQAQMVASLLREEMDKNYASRDELSRLKKDKEKEKKD